MNWGKDAPKEGDMPVKERKPSSERFRQAGLVLFLVPFGLILSLMTVPLRVTVPGVEGSSALSDLFGHGFFGIIARLIASAALIYAGVSLSIRSSPKETGLFRSPNGQHAESYWRAITVAILVLMGAVWIAIWSGAIDHVLPVAQRSFDSKPIAWNAGSLIVTLSDIKHITTWAQIVIIGVLGERTARSQSFDGKLLWGYALFSLLFLFKGPRESLAPLASGFGFLVGLIMLIGTGLLLWDRTELEKGPPWSLFGAISLLSLVAALFAPGASSIVSSLARGVLSVLNVVLNLVLIPIGYVAGFLISKIKALIKYTTDQPEIQFKPGKRPDLLEEAKKAFQTPLFMKILGWLIVAAILAFLGFLLWRYLMKEEHGKKASLNEIRENEWSSQEALKWAGRASRKILNAIIPRKRTNGKPRSQTAIETIYMEFLGDCEKKGVSRMTFETPLEFAENLISKAPKAASQAKAISCAFSMYFYSGRDPEKDEIVSLRKTLREFRQIINDSSNW